MTEIEKLRVAIVAAKTNAEAMDLIDRAYALGRSERGEKMPVGLKTDSMDKSFQWTTETYDAEEINSDMGSIDYESESAAIESARKFWARFGVEIEVVP